MLGSVLLSWIYNLLLYLWRWGRSRMQFRALVAETEAAFDERVALWAVWVQEGEGEPRLVAFVDGTRDAAREVSEVFIADFIWTTRDVFVGRTRVEEVDLADEGLLKIALSAAVPLQIAELRGKPWSELQERAAAAAQVVASKGDLILFKSQKRGETAAAFNKLAEGIAICAFAPGGVKIFGLHFEAKHEGGP